MALWNQGVKEKYQLQWSGKFFYVYCLLIKNRSCLTTNIEIILIIIMLFFPGLDSVPTIYCIPSLALCKAYFVVL